MDYVIVGQIVNTHGIKGELKVKSSTDFVEERFKKGAILYILFEGQYKEVEVLSYRFHKGCILVTFKGYQDINLVECYKGCNLYGIKDLDLLDDDEYYVGDLIGCDVYDGERCVGKVSDVQLYDHHDILVVEGKERVLIPYVDAFVGDVDIDERRIDVHLIEGFYDEN